MKSAKKAAKKKAVNKKAVKKKTSTLAATNKKKKKAVMIHRREDIAGINLDLPDESNWKLAAKALHVEPFGPVPWWRFHARQVPDPKPGGRWMNDFYLADTP
jgi:hypothetical protein